MKTVGLLIFMLLCVVSVFGKNLPSFVPEPLAWSSTDIVVAYETEKPAQFVVREIWKGTMNAGDIVAVDAMSEYQREAAKRVHRDASDGFIIHPDGVLLFLDVPMEHAKALPVTPWGMQASFAWLQSGTVYAFRQSMNPGPSLLVEVGTLEELLVKVQPIIRDRQRFDSLTTVDCRELPEQLERITSSKFFFESDAAVKAFRACGPASLPTLRRLLTTRSEVSARAVEVFADIGGTSVSDELAQMLADDVRTWKVIAPTLPVGWWNNIQEERTERLRSQYIFTQELLRALTKLPVKAAEPSVRELRELWASLPQLNDRSGIDAITADCDLLLAAMKE
jgi:hypothetical protein